MLKEIILKYKYYKLLKYFKKFFNNLDQLNIPYSKVLYSNSSLLIQLDIDYLNHLKFLITKSYNNRIIVEYLPIRLSYEKNNFFNLQELEDTKINKLNGLILKNILCYREK